MDKILALRQAVSDYRAKIGDYLESRTLNPLYFCLKCGHKHKVDSKIGVLHKVHDEVLHYYAFHVKCNEDELNSLITYRRKVCDIEESKGGVCTTYNPCSLKEILQPDTLDNTFQKNRAIWLKRKADGFFA